MFGLYGICVVTSCAIANDYNCYLLVRQFGGRTILTASVAEEEFFPPGEAPPAPPPIDQATDAALADILA